MLPWVARGPPALYKTGDTFVFFNTNKPNHCDNQFSSVNISFLGGSNPFVQASSSTVTVVFLSSHSDTTPKALNIGNH